MAYTELQDVFDFMGDATDDELDEIASKLDIDIDDLNDQIEGLEDQVSEYEEEIKEYEKEMEKLENKLDIRGFEVNTLYDEMKLKLLVQAFKSYSLEEMEQKLGKEHQLNIGLKVS